MQWRSMNDDELLLQGGKVIERERAQTILLIEFLQEVDRRKLHLRRGYPSLFEMLTKHFQYCAGSAQIRINSMRLVSDVPEAKEKLASGSISLTAVSQVQSFLRQEKKIEHVYSREQKLGLIEMCEGKSSREVERELAGLNPDFVNRESVRAVSSERSRMLVTVSNRLVEKLNKLKAHFSHSHSSMSYEQIFERLADDALLEIERRLRTRRSKGDRKVKKTGSKSRETGTAVLNNVKAGNAKSIRTESDIVQVSSVELDNDLSIDSTIVGLELHAHEVRGEDVIEAVKVVNGCERPEVERVKVGKRSQTRTRHIPAAVRREVFFKGRERGCEYVDGKTGRRCGSTYFLQVDHRLPFSFGGEHSPKNLRLLCGAHNRFEYSESLRRQSCRRTLPVPAR